MTEHPSVVPTGDLAGPGGAAVAGVKLARLARLGQAGLRVPGGFAVTVHAFRRHLADSGLAGVLPARLAALPDPLDHAALAAASAGLGLPVRDTPVAGPLRAEITRACARYCRGTVAVRSSAVAEDGADHSFAGMFDSFLGVRTSDEVVAAVQGCWASLFTHRCLAYRMHAGLPVDALAMGVGVMELVPARVSGVAFSMHPVTGRRDRTVVEAAPGVGGAVTGGPEPERLEIARPGVRVLRRAYGSTGRPLLSDAELTRVVEAVHRAEDVLGHPVDVEWALDPEGGVWLLQARPVTGIAPEGDDRAWDPAAFLSDL
ncbi:PEP/pyruvate-binding domain-containing protein [Streptomyces sp. GC420]|uniref:PEP/pyruvate-binding domain-containing protein n=1 Tax=Streptomyces sp. GC420 TaxID=2697568 RepID=UPI001415167F|nr:PEP/pyruvate-binding domain-containing protein [Streptomyces sp. GC420]NBM16131.1 pyruvate kinase [Streptomyces sp. GC420]